MLGSKELRMIMFFQLSIQANLFKHRVTVVGSIDYSPRYHPKVGNMIPLGLWAMGCPWLSSFVTQLWMETLGNAY
jgi:hypothetical protein